MKNSLILPIFRDFNQASFNLFYLLIIYHVTFKSLRNKLFEKNVLVTAPQLGTKFQPQYFVCTFA